MDGGLETKVAFGDMMQAFEAFKDANDERLAQIEARMSADIVTTEKVDRINRAVDEAKARLDELTLKARRPQLPFQPRWQMLPQGFWDFLAIGMGGYIGGRSLEKVAGAVSAAVERPRKPG